MQPQPNVWTCGAGLIEALAQRVLAGFPLAEDGPHDLTRWTILVPTRRAARALEEKLFTLSRTAALLLPRVRPIGDTDEDLLADAFPQEGIPDAASPLAQLFMLLGLIDEWAAANPQLPLAADVRQSRSQALGLAQSLSDLVTQLETEEIAPDFASIFRELDLAEHRLTILSLLDLVQEQLPKRLHEQQLMGAAARRNLLLRLEARRISEGGVSGPIIAAGSTGTNPATRDLLKAIARHPQGAVILPGLDRGLDDAAWEAAGPNHPQHALKLLLAHLEVPRSAVQEFAPPGPRAILAREIMRPADTTERWADPSLLPAATVDAACRNMRLIEAPDRQTEARSIALLLRETLETPGARAALVTPDRDLAQMVAAELRRWSAEIDDSGGEPLIRFGRAQLCKLVMDCISEDCASASLVALLAHPLVTLGGEPGDARHLAHRFEMALLRQDLPPSGPAQFLPALAAVQRSVPADPHAHRLLTTLTAADWQVLTAFTARFASALQPLTGTAEAPLDLHIAALTACLESLAPATEADITRQPFDDVMDALRQESRHHPVCSLRDALPGVIWALRQETLRPQRHDGTRLAIFGLAEARMIEAERVVLAGLNETIWPAAVDPGPWVNRSMRASLGLAQPERQIGMTAHDLAQGLSHADVVLTWSRRAGTAPLMPSRWILRLRALLEKAGRAADQHLDTSIPVMARLLDHPHGVETLAMPRPCPPVALRPVSFSVTEIETLIRDPYAIFARRILELQPLDPLGGTADYALRGTLFHEALRRFVEEGATTLEGLLAIGSDVFAPYVTHPDVQHFWWPRFKRMAAAFVGEDAKLRAAAAARFVERKGFAEFAIAGEPHRLRARADRIDITSDGRARFIDYKTGVPPTHKQVEAGLNPQLTLEAAILRHGSFAGISASAVDDLLYIQTGGGRPPVAVTSLSDKFSADVASVAQKHFDGLKELLTSYRSARQPYVPRAVMYKESDVSDVDHLSRHAEWSRSGA